MRMCLVALALLAVSAPAASAQQLSREQLLQAAYGARRTGEWDAATFAFEQAVRDMPKSPQKKIVALDLADLYLTIGRWEQAMMLFRRNHDVEREFDLYMERKEYDQALTLARLLNYPRGEGKALAYLQQYDEGLRVLERAGLHREQAELLYKLKRFDEAADVYARVPDQYWRARALERAGKTDEARDAYRDAEEGMTFDWREEVGPFWHRARSAFQDAADGVSREQARTKLAEAEGDASDLYEKLAVICYKTGRRDSAAKMFENAIRFRDLQIEHLLDAANGGCEFGKLKVESLDLRDKLDKLRKLKERLS